MLQTELLETFNKLPESLQQEVVHYAEFLSQKHTQTLTGTEQPKKRRQAGAMKGVFVLPLPDDFDEPLEELKEYME